MRRQRGAALLMALLVLALSVVLVAALLDQGDRQRGRLRDTLRAEQSWQLMLGLEAWALDALATRGPAIDTLDDPWLQPMPPLDVPGGRLQGRLFDLGGCFDINSLAPAGVADPARVQAFERLLAGLQLDPAIAAQAADWIDADAEPLPGGAEDGAYLGLQPGWRTPNRPMAHPSEARLLRGMDARTWARLSPHVCALPERVALNANTASAVVWTSVDPRIDDGMARRLVRGPGSAWTSIEALRQALAREGLVDVDLAGLGLATHYYLAEGWIEADGLTFVHGSLIERDPATGRLRVLGRSRGRFAEPPATGAR